MGVRARRPVDVDRFNHIHVVLFTDADNFESKEPTKKATTMDKWEGEDEDENVKVNEVGRGGLEPPCVGARSRCRSV